MTNGDGLVLVTGGTGFIGNHIVRMLLAHGHRVRVLDNGYRSEVSRLRDVAHLVEIVVGDVRDAETVDTAMRGVQWVWHLACVNGTKRFYEAPHLVLDVGIRGTIEVLRAAQRHDVQGFVLFSSSEVYGTPAQVPTPETAPLVISDPFNPRFSYAAAKLASEMLTLHAPGLDATRALIIRPHNVYGPDMGDDHVVPQFAVRMAELASSVPAGEVMPFPIQGSGHETRSFIYIDDMVRACEKIWCSGQAHGIYHVGTSDQVEISTVAHLIARCFGRDIEVRPWSVPSAKGGTWRREPDVTKLEHLGFKPQISLDRGLAKTVSWYTSRIGSMRQ